MPVYMKTVDDTNKTNEPSNFLIENKKVLGNLYFDAIGEKEILKTLFERKKYPHDKLLDEVILLDNLIKSIARIIYPNMR